MIERYLYSLTRFYFIICLAAILAGTAWAGGEDDGRRKLTSAKRIVIAESAAWGVITALADGSLGLTYQVATPIEGTNTVHVAMVWVRSTDGGKTWSKPVTVVDRRGPDGKRFIRRNDGGMIVFEQRNQALGQLPSGRIVCAMAELDYYCDKNGKEEKQNFLGSTFQFKQIVYTWSDDMGATWAPARVLDSRPFGGKHTFEPYRGASPHWQIVTLDDGTAMMSLYGSKDPEYKGPVQIPEGTTYMAGVTRSRDNGETWGDVSLIFSKTSGLPYEETALCLLPGDRLLAHMRTQNHDIMQYVSEDKGRTWNGPTRVTEGGQQPGGALRLKSGRLLATWGNRRPPYFGVGAMLSSDNGKSWDYDRRVALAWDHKNANCGYANAAQAGDGSIVVTYYSMDPNANDHVGRWSGSKVYAIRFSEEEFIGATGE
ncbi:MAG: exo-alpha-sialidase [Pirellulales bacterium]|nr:exo-alpha-sialidase [Pirellulales bacterium]